MKLLVPALLGVLVAPAMADFGSSASITGLRYELVDLDPHDGIQPTLDLTGVSSAFAYARRRACVERDGCMRDLGSFQEPVFVSASDAEGRSASASASGEGLFSAGRFDTKGRVDGDWYGAFANYRSGPGQPTFTVSPHTAVRVSGHYSLVAWSTTDPRLGRPVGSRAGFFFTSRFADDAVSTFITAGTAKNGIPDAQHEEADFSVLLVNDQVHRATLGARFGVFVQGQIFEVPEPATGALILSGLGVMGVAARRRARHEGVRTGALEGTS